MKNIKEFLLVFVLFVLGTTSHASNPNVMGENNMDRKHQVKAFLKSLETGDSEPFSYLHPNTYIQHNLNVADGLEGLSELAKHLPPDVKVETIRVYQDGDYVFAHTDYNFFGPKVGFDVFRYENGKIVEHWDNLQEKPSSANPSGHTMLDGPTEAMDLDKTDKNKMLVKNFVNTILVNGEMDKLGNYFDGDNYIQHNPNISDGLSGLSKAIQAMEKQGITMKYEKVHKILGEGNFVLVMSEGEFAGKPASFYDLFRVENGYIAEHWDTIESIPPRDKWANENGKF